MSENSANIVALIGASGQGKSATFKQWLREGKPPRLIIADPMDEYGEHAAECRTLEEVVRASAAESFAVRYVPAGDPDKMRERFNVLCSIAYARGNLTLAVEELPMFVTASHAPASWTECMLRGRHKGLVIVGLGQRAALVDKNFFSNATRVRCFRLNFRPDVATMAGVLGVDAERVVTLKPLQYLERDMATGQVSEGVLSFGPPVAAAAPRERQPVKKPRGRPRKKRR